MSDSFTIELWRYKVNDGDVAGSEYTTPARWSRHWSDPTPNLNLVYEHALESAKEWQARQDHHGCRVELVGDGERMILIEFPPKSPVRG